MNSTFETFAYPVPCDIDPRAHSALVGIVIVPLSVTVSPTYEKEALKN